MSIKVYFEGSTLLHPGVYTRKRIKQVGGFPLTGANIIGIVGEATGGEPGSTDGVQTFYSNQMSDLQDKYISGPIVDAVKALIAPARDARVPGGADIIRIYKTNAGTQGAAVVNNISATPVAMYDITSKNYGADENYIYYYITEGAVTEKDCEVTSGTVTLPVTFVAGDKFIITVNGVVYTYTVAASAGSKATIAAVVSALNTDAEWAPSRPIIATEATSTTLKIALNYANTALDEYNVRNEYSVLSKINGGPDVTINLAAKLEFINSIAFATNGLAGGTFTVASSTGLSVGQIVSIDDDDSAEIVAQVTAISGTGPFTIQVDNGATDLSGFTTAQNAKVYINGSVINSTTLALTVGTGGPIRGNRGSRIVTVGRNTYIETMDDNQCATMLRIWYRGTGTACPLTIQDVGATRKLTTTVTGGPGSQNLDIILKNYTVQELVDYINNFASGCYTAYAVYGYKTTQTCEVLDYYNAIDIRTIPLELKAINWEITNIVNDQSTLIDIDLKTNIYGPLETIASTAREFLSGATLGASSNTTFQDGFDAMLLKRCNIIVPLISRDATDDITDSLTDASSTYTIDSVNMMADTHCRTASSVKNRSERNCYVSFLADSFTTSRQKAEDINSEYTSLAIQEVQATDVEGNTTWFQPWYFACLCAGIQAGMDIGTPLTYKYLNCLGLTHDEFDPAVDFDAALESGIIFAEEPDSGGFRIVRGNTTYGKDSNIVLNSIGSLAAAHYVAYTVRNQIESLYIGQKLGNKETSAESIKTTIMALMTKFKDVDIIVGDDTNDQLGYKGLSVSVNSGIIYIDLTITVVTSIDFVLGTITIDTTRTTV